jgi:hypothetical protein
LAMASILIVRVVFEDGKGVRCFGEWFGRVDGSECTFVVMDEWMSVCVKNEVLDEVNERLNRSDLTRRERGRLAKRRRVCNGGGKNGTDGTENCDWDPILPWKKKRRLRKSAASLSELSL